MMQPKQFITFEDAAFDMERLCEVIDESDDITDTLQELFAEKDADLKESIDKRIRYLLYADSAIKKADEMMRSWRTRKDSMERLKEKLEEKTMSILKAFPDKKFRGDLGSLTVRKNPPALKAEFQTVHYEILDGGFLSQEQKEDLMEYLTEEKHYRLDKMKLKKDMMEGREIRGAEITRGEKVKITFN